MYPVAKIKITINSKEVIRATPFLFRNGSGRSSRLAFDGSLPLLYSIFVSSTRKRLNTLYVLKGYAWNTRLSVPKTRNPSSIFFLSDASNSLLSWQYMSIVVVPSACPMTCESIVVGTPFLCMFVPKQRRPECGVMSSAMILLFRIAGKHQKTCKRFVNLLWYRQGENHRKRLPLPIS